MPPVGRQEIWWANLNPPGRGTEIHKKRPVLVVSVDQINNGPGEVVIIVPLGSHRTGIPSHIPIDPPEGGVKKTSYIRCDQVRMISKQRLEKPLGRVLAKTMSQVEQALKFLLGL